MVPPMLIFLSRSELVSKYNLSSLQFIMTAAAPIGKELIDAVMKKIPTIKRIAQGKIIITQLMCIE